MEWKFKRGGIDVYSQLIHIAVQKPTQTTNQHNTIKQLHSNNKIKKKTELIKFFKKWGFFGGNDAEAETPVLWPPHAKSLLIGKDSDAGRDWGQEEKGTTEDEMAEWHH